LYKEEFTSQNNNEGNSAKSEQPEANEHSECEEDEKHEVKNGEKPPIKHTDAEIEVEEESEAKVETEEKLEDFDLKEAEKEEEEVEVEVEEEKVTGEETVESLKQKVERFLQEKEEALEMVQRIKADYDNYRKIAASEKEDIRNYALFEFMGEMLPVIDNLERALQATENDDSVPQSHVEGLNMIYKQLCQLLEKHGVCAIEAEGCTFDPHYHQAVMQVEEGDYESQDVVEELQKGYMMKDRVLRPSMVKVYTGAGKSS